MYLFNNPPFTKDNKLAVSLKQHLTLLGLYTSVSGTNKLNYLLLIESFIIENTSTEFKLKSLNSCELK